MLPVLQNYAQPGITTKQLDDYGATILADLGAESHLIYLIKSRSQDKG